MLERERDSPRRVKIGSLWRRRKQGSKEHRGGIVFSRRSRGDSVVAAGLLEILCAACDRVEREYMDLLFELFDKSALCAVGDVRTIARELEREGARPFRSSREDSLFS